MRSFPQQDSQFRLLPLLILFATLSLPGRALSETVHVYGEGEFSESMVTVRIYADIQSGNLISFGVKLSYNPADLSLVSAEKNEETWYFGQGAQRHAYVDPVTTNPGEVIIVGGKLDADNPAAGVGGDKILLGTVRFNRATANPPAVSLSIGKNGDYKNFVTTGNVILDDDTQALRFGAVTLSADSPGNPESDGGSDSGDSSSSGICFITLLF
ncbi:MAG: hypothetical protein ACOZF0_03015 [Thermodesulfobacteriota bacterium]